MYKGSYVLITPARNEETHIDKTIKSVISQTVLPKKWVIVSDGSTDRTDEIVIRYSTNHDFIELLHLETDGNRNFASQVHAFQAGYERLRGIEYGFVGCLDADVSFGPDYYAYILQKFDQNMRLGVAGGIVSELAHGNFVIFRYTLSSVAQAVQLFRRQCYEEIGGYVPLEYGGADTVAEAMARMHGWETKTFPEIEVIHHRRTGTEGRGIYRARFRSGVAEYLLGYHPIFHLAKCFYRIRQKPYLVGGLLMMCGYYWPCCRRHKRQVGDDFVRYLRREQMHKIWPPLIGKHNSMSV